MFDETVGLVEASIGRMVPVQTEEMKDGDPMRVSVEGYGFLPVDKAAFKGDIPSITNMVPFEPFDFYIKRKLYIHNMGHATCAYLGDLLGLEYICLDGTLDHLKQLKLLNLKSIPLKKLHKLPKPTSGL